MAICLGHARTPRASPIPPFLPFPSTHSPYVCWARRRRKLLVVFGAIFALNPNPAFFLAFRCRSASSAHPPKGDGSQRAQPMRFGGEGSVSRYAPWRQSLAVLQLTSP
eukprot:scaffold27208_cov46-Phaeocystis_antarctica.AAC.2